MVAESQRVQGRIAVSRFFRDQRKWSPYLFVAPFFIIFAIFTLYPLLRAVLMAFQTNVGFSNQWDWVGTANFRDAFQDRHLGVAFRNFLYYAAGSLVTQVPFAFLLAMVLASPALRGRGFFRTVYFIPSVLPGVAMALVGLWFFNRERGVANALWLTLGGAEPIAWGMLPQHILPIMLFISFWQWVGNHAVFLLAGMGGIDQSIIEASIVDGATAWQRARYIIMPLLRPVFAFVTITVALGSLTLYDVAIVVLGESQGGPGGQGWFFLPYITYTAFLQFRMGYATAVGWVVFSVALVITYFQLKLYNFGEIK
jgi:ABC-type sugar transport system permease subunit